MTVKNNKYHQNKIFQSSCDFIVYDSITRIRFISQSKDDRRPVLKQLTSYALERNTHKDKFLWNKLYVTTKFHLSGSCDIESGLT